MNDGNKILMSRLSPITSGCLFFSFCIQPTVLLRLALVCTLLLSYRAAAANRKKYLTAFDDERKTAVRDFFASTLVNLALFVS